MYIPASFVKADPQELHDFIAAHSFGTLVSHSEDEPAASHIPFLLDRNVAPHGRLTGHVARANPQWKTLEDSRVLVIFSGPHTYISPAWYTAKNVVPTWNYVAVHVYGRVRLVSDPDRLLDILRRTVDVYEASRSEPWSLDEPDDDFVRGLLDAIVGFDIEIERIEGKWKLSQNHDEERRRRVIDELRAAGSANDIAIADLMGR